MTLLLEILINETRAKIDVINLPTLEVDASQIQQIFQNLIGNALKYRTDSASPKINVRSRYMEKKNMKAPAWGSRFADILSCAMAV